MFGNKFLKILFCVILLITCIPIPAFAAQINENPKDVPPTSAESAILMSAGDGAILYSKNPNKKLPVASVTKLMTMLLAVENIENGRAHLEDSISASENAWGMGGSQIYLEPGEELSYRELLLSVALGSANDASVALAEHISGSVESFVEAMNLRAKELGCTDTNFVNTTGLPAEGHYTTASDLAKIMQECIKHPLFMEMSGTYEHDLRGGEFKLWNTNKLLKWYRGVDAGKTGWTNDAKYCLASTCERDGLRLIAIVLGSPETRSHFRESIKLYNYGYARYQAESLAEKNQVIKTIPVNNGTQDTIDLITKEKVVVAVRKGDTKNLQSKIDIPDKVTAPVKSGQVIGQYIVTKGNSEILRVPIIAHKDVYKRSFTQQINKALRSILE